MQKEKCKLLPGVQVECDKSQKRLVVEYLVKTGCKNPKYYNGTGDGPVDLKHDGSIEYAEKCMCDKVITYAEFEKLIAEPAIPEVINNYSIY